jgi:hypothetical protein
MKIKNYTIFDLDGQLVVDVDSDVRLQGFGLTEINVKFNIAKKDFICSQNKLRSLEGCPEKVGEIFSCEHNLLTSLKFAPKKVGGDFWCINNKIVRVNNPVWLEHFKNKPYNIRNNQLLDTNFLDIKYKKLFETIKYDLKTLKENKEAFKQFLNAGLISVENINLDLWS